MTRRSFILATAFAAVLAVCAPAARGEELKEYQVKAAFLYNFTQFVQWPEGTFKSADEPFVVAVVGDDPFGSAIDAAMSGKTVMNHTVVVRRYSSVTQYKPCHLLFVSKSEDVKLGQLFDAIGKSPVLTVGETDAFPWAGGTMRFFMEDNRVRFEVNLDSAKTACLEISSKLLKLARIFKK